MNDNLNYILIDSTRLTSLQICPQKFKYSFMDNLRSIENKDYFEVGSLYHIMLKTHYSVLKYSLASMPLTIKCALAPFEIRTRAVEVLRLPTASMYLPVVVSLSIY